MPDRDGLAHVEGLAKVTLRAALVVSPVAVAAAFASGFEFILSCQLNGRHSDVWNVS